ncbi:MAG: thermonuclease family protein, partial [Syntrophobacterales bacterium]
KVAAIQDEETILLDNGNLVRFLGIHIEKHDETKKYLQEYLLGKYVVLKDATVANENGIVSAYIYLKNKIFINAYLIKSGLASPDFQVEHRYAEKFRRLAEKTVKVSQSISA